MAAVLIVAGLGLTGCAASSQAEAGQQVKPATVSNADGGGAKQVTLIQEAADRLAIQTVQVAEKTVPARVPGGPNAARRVVPYAALLYDVNGEAWVYTVSKPLSFVRQRLVVDYVTGEFAVLSDGPQLGTSVVTKGAAELYGTELNAGK
jgi:hypothetical protein